MITVGRTVLMRLADWQAKQIMERRAMDANADGQSMVRAGTEVPVIVTAVHGETMINGQAILDGNDSLWVTSIDQTDTDKQDPGCWYWPPRVK